MNFERFGILWVIVFACMFVSGLNITGNVIATGEVIAEDVSVRISVVGVPVLDVISPKNNTYFYKKILLDYSTGGIDEVWYNIDGGNNRSIDSSVSVSVAEGSHVINFYAENGYGVSNVVREFVVNFSKFKVTYNDYNDLKRGKSSNFNEYSYEEIQELEDVILEQTDYGKIKFKQAINLVEVGGSIDLDLNVKISKNSIKLDSVALPNFNKSARLYFYDLNFVNPRILKDGNICSPDVCDSKSYLDGILSFDVSGFTTYSVEDTPSSSGGGGGSSSGGYSGGVDLESLGLSLERMGVLLREGEIVTKEIVLTNYGEEELVVDISYSELGDLVIFGDYDMVVLGVGESKSIYVDFVARREAVVQDYLGKLIFRAGNIEKEILVSVSVESNQELFDAEARIVQGEVVSAGDYLVMEFDIWNMGNVGVIDTEIEYLVKDVKGEVLFSEKDVRAVETNVSFVKRFKMPDDIESGDYVIYTNVRYADDVVVRVVWFEVKPAQSLYEVLVFVGIGLLVLILWLRKRSSRYSES